MKIENLKDLKAVLDLCNKQGVRAITIDGIAMQLNGLDKATPVNNAGAPEAETPVDEEAALFWSANQTHEI